MNCDPNPPPSIKEAMLLSFAGLFPFATNPPHHASNARFWLCSTEGKATKVSGEAWLKKFPPRNRRVKVSEEEAARQGGRIVVGLAEGGEEKDLEQIEARLPDLLADLIAKELAGAGWVVGRFGFGIYMDMHGTLYDNRSVVVIIAGVGSAALHEVARQIAEGLGQTSVMVFDDVVDEMYLMGPER